VGQLELLVRLVLRGHPVRKARSARPELLVLQDQSVLKVRLAPEVIKDHPAFKAYREFQVHRDL
jgi:hypothetical protein